MAEEVPSPVLRIPAIGDTSQSSPAGLALNPRLSFPLHEQEILHDGFEGVGVAGLGVPGRNCRKFLSRRENKSVPAAIQLE